MLSVSQMHIEKTRLSIKPRCAMESSFDAYKMDFHFKIKKKDVERDVFGMQKKKKKKEVPRLSYH